MTAGFDWNEDLSLTDPRNDQLRIFQEARPLHHALSRPIVAEPGSVFRYNGALTQVMVAVVERAAKMPLRDYARTKLFEPLGIVDVDWLGSVGAGDLPAPWLRLHPRDLAKFGSLYLHGGQWNGKQVIPADWIEQSTRRHVRVPSPPGVQSENGYGYYWWYFCAPGPTGVTELRAAIGDGGQRVHVYPGLQMVVTVLAGRYNDPDPGSFGVIRPIMREHILPAVKSDVAHRVSRREDALIVCQGNCGWRRSIYGSLISDLGQLVLSRWSCAVCSSRYWRCRPLQAWRRLEQRRRAHVRV